MEVVARDDEQHREVNPNQSNCQSADEPAVLCQAAPLLPLSVSAEVDLQAQWGGAHDGQGQQREGADESDHKGIDANPGW